MVLPWEPIREVEEHAGEETRLGHTQQEPDDRKARRIGDERHGAGEDAPRDHDARNPKPRAYLFHNDVAWHLKDEVAEKKGSERKSEIGSGQFEIAAHR